MVLRKAIATMMFGALMLIGSAGAATADPIEEFCERGPRDGKARVHRLVCD